MMGRLRKLLNDIVRQRDAALAQPEEDRYPEESLALRILQEQKDLEAHTRAVTDVDRLTQIRDSILKEPQP